MRVLGLRIRHFVFRHRTRLRIESANIVRKISREPDVALAVGGQTVGARVVYLQWEFFECPQRRIDAADLVLHLLGKPKGAIGANGRIVRMRALGGHVPLFDGNMQLADSEFRGKLLAPLRDRSYPGRRRLARLSSSRCNHARRTRCNQHPSGAYSNNGPPTYFHEFTSRPNSSACASTFREDSLPPKPKSGKQGECYPCAPEIQSHSRVIFGVGRARV